VTLYFKGNLDTFLNDLSAASSLTGAEQIMVRQNGGARIADLGDVVLGYAGFIDPHKLGAKGDTVRYRDGIVVNGSNDFESVSHTFTAADIGKSFYSDAIGTGRRTVTAVNVGGNPKKITLNGSPLALTGSDRYWIMGTDDTAALRAALLLAGTNRGGGIAGSTTSATKNRNYGRLVVLRPDSCYLVRNTSAEYASGAGTLAALSIPPRAGIVGQAGVRNAMIFAAPDHCGHVVMNSVPDGFHDFLTVANFTIHGSKGLSQANSLNALHLDFAFNGYDETDAFFNVFNMDTVDGKQHGFYLNGRGEGIVSNMRSIGASSIGILIDGCMDSTFVAMNGGGCSKTGIKVNRTPSSRFIGCKAFYNGISGAAVAGDCANWWITGDDHRNSTSVFSACEAQESRGSSFLIEGGMSIFSGCVAGDPGRFALANSGSLPSVRAGFELSGSLCRYNTFSDCTVQPSVGLFTGVAETVENETTQPTRSLRNWGWGTDSVYIDGNAAGNRGNIWTYPLTDYDAANGAKGGAGVSNAKNTLMKVDGVALT